MDDFFIGHRDFIKLSKRLSMSTAMVTPGNVVADVGCDHAHTDIFLVKAGISPRAIAMDVGEGPLSHAKANVRLYGLDGFIELRLSDGLEMLRPYEADTLIMAGMGGTLTTLILDKYPNVTASFKELILQPQSDPDLVRRFLRMHGFKIVLEDMCIEDGKFYNAMKAVHAENTDETGKGTLEAGIAENADETGKGTLEAGIAENADETGKGTLEAGTAENADETGKGTLKAGIAENADGWERDDCCKDSYTEGLPEDDIRIQCFDRFGEYLLKTRNVVLKELLLQLKEKNLRVIQRIESSGNAGSDEKHRFFLKEKEIIGYALKQYHS